MYMNKRVKRLVSLVSVVVLMTTCTFNVFAGSEAQETIFAKSDENSVIEPRISYVVSETMPYGCKSSDYTKYIGTSNSNTFVDALLQNATISMLEFAIGRATGLSAARSAAAALRSGIASQSVTGSTLYYTYVTYQSSRNIYEYKVTYKYYGNSARTKYLYSHVVYKTKIPG